MQPYFFPYLGYFQLMAAADLFVFHDDVQYIKQGWVNRNKIMQNGKAVFLTLPVAAGSHRLPISGRRLADSQVNLQKLFARICGAYRHAPYFAEMAALLRPLFTGHYETIAEFNIASLRRLRDIIGIGTPDAVASEHDYGQGAAGQDKVIRICRREGATRYINPIGAKAIGLYRQTDFEAAGLELFFLRPRPDLVYEQGKEPFVPGLSIIDVLMHNSPAKIREMLPMYELERA